ncbi:MULTISPECIES: hypothetical protein [Luteimonas]|uniref:hypothetical protein n=1 Tax=Luteimonas TaxID=83614 RepID=UPI000C7DF945|nr:MULTISPECIES: hypothetical protein [Luteimonas]
MDRAPLTFEFLDAQIEAMPEGPVAALNMPRWIRLWTLIGVAGTVLALSPSLLIQWLTPAQWMVAMAQTGLAIMIVGFAPGFVRNLHTMWREFRQHRRGLIAQFDHDTGEFRALATRLSRYPRQELEAQARAARMGYDRLGSRLVMMVGGIERLGLVPLLLSLFVVLRNWRDLIALPSWIAFFGVMAAILWVIGWAGAEFRRRLQYYAYLLDEALIIQGETGMPAG